jgi:hypothetical protein
MFVSWCLESFVAPNDLLEPRTIFDELISVFSHLAILALTTCFFSSIFRIEIHCALYVTYVVDFLPYNVVLV